MGMPESYRDCELSRAAVKSGDMPPVCVRCGEAINQFRWVRLYYRGKYYSCLLPLCDADFTTGRRKRLVWMGTLLGLGFVVGGILMMEWASRHRSAPLASVAGLMGLFMLPSGLVVGLVIGVWDGLVHHERSIRIKRLDGRTMTLAGVAPAFVEALRIHSEESAWRKPSAEAEPAPYAEQTPWPDPALGGEIRQIADAAMKVALALGHEYVGTEHLLLALCTVPSAAAIALDQATVGAKRVREEILTNNPRKRSAPSSVTPTPRLKKIVTALTEEANRADNLLLALLRESDAEAAQILLRLGVDPELLCEKIAKLQRTPTAASQNPRAP
jgi:ClpA/ClpB-like protein